MDSISLLRDYIKTNDKAIYKKYKQLTHLIDTTRKVLSNYLVEIGSRDIPKKTANEHMSLILSARSLERIPILGYEFIKALRATIKKEQFDVSEEAKIEFNTLLKVINSITKRGTAQLRRYSSKRKSEMTVLVKKLDTLTEEYSKNHVKRKQNSTFDYLAEIKLLERMGHHGMRLQKYTRKGKKEVDPIKLDAKLEKELSIDF